MAKAPVKAAPAKPAKATTPAKAPTKVSGKVATKAEVEVVEMGITCPDGHQLRRASAKRVERGQDAVEPCPVDGCPWVVVQRGKTRTFRRK